MFAVLPCVIGQVGGTRAVEPRGDRAISLPHRPVATQAVHSIQLITTRKQIVVQDIIGKVCILEGRFPNLDELGIVARDEALDFGRSDLGETSPPFSGWELPVLLNTGQPLNGFKDTP